MNKKMRILVLDGVSARGVDILKNEPKFQVDESKSLSEEELIKKIPGYDALVLRSQTKVTRKAIQAANKLKVIGRAGVGVDNIDLNSATEKGVIVMNTPGGNTVSTAEHTFSLILSLARNIPQAHQSMKEGRWDRKKFQGTEIFGKTLGVLGMGRIGTEVARRAQAFGMRVLAMDPYLSQTRAQNLQVELFDDLEKLLPKCDFITMHMPLTPETTNMLNKKTLAKCKPTACVVNCARGGLVNEADLEDALKKGKLGGAALDVYEVEPPPANFGLRKLDNVIMVPHLGASTLEAQVSVGIEVAESIRDMLLEGSIRNAVNMPNVDAKTLAVLRPYLDLGFRLGKMLAQISPSRTEELTVSYSGKIAEQDTTPVSRAVLKGYLSQAGGMDVNEVNAPRYAQNLGLKFSEVKESELKNYSDLVTVRTQHNGKTFEMSGTFFGNSPRLVNINGYSLDACPEKVMLFFENKDCPGIVGRIGTLMGKHGVNIGNMSLSRNKPGTRALCVLNLDSVPPENAVKKLGADNDIFSVQTIQL